MAKLLLISNSTYRPGVNDLDDLVGVFEDTHIFSGHENNIFNIVTVEDKKDKIDKDITDKRKIKSTDKLYQLDNNEYSWNKPDDKSRIQAQIDVIEENGGVYIISAKPKYEWKYTIVDGVKDKIDDIVPISGDISSQIIDTKDK